MRSAALNTALVALTLMGIVSLGVGLVTLVQGLRSREQAKRPTRGRGPSRSGRVTLPTTIDGLVLDTSKPLALIILGAVALFAAGSLAASHPGGDTAAVYPVTPPSRSVEGSVGTSSSIDPSLATPSIDASASRAPNGSASTNSSSAGTRTTSPVDSRSGSVARQDSNPGPAPAPTPPDPPKPVSPTVTLLDPTNGENVGACKVIAGTSANIPVGSTLVTVKHKPGGDHYVEVPTGWKSSATLARWSDTQYFNQADGESFTVSVYLASLSEVQSAKNDPRYQNSWSLGSLPPSWRRLAEVSVLVSNSVKSDC